MTHSIWSHLCHQPTVTASTDKYEHLVYESTAELHQSFEPVMSALDRRAMALAKSASFEAALRDANAIQQLSPSSARGYICAAKVYSEQGKQRHVIDTCNQGLAMIDRMDADYDTLQRMRMDAEQRDNTRIDFISQLPVDIAIATLIPLFMNHVTMIVLRRNPFLSVSHTWLDRIVQSLGGLPFLIKSKDDLALLYAIRLSRHTRDLHVRDYTKGTWLGDLLLNNDFSSLQKLHVDNFGSKHINHFLASLRSVGNTLTHLQLDTEGGPAIDILDVMTACPKLTTLCIYHIMHVNVSSRPMITWPTLTTLTLLFAYNPISCDQIISIWKRFPSLKKLELDPCTDISSTFIVPDYRPSMKSLHLKMSFTGAELIYTDEGNSNEEPGLTKLIIEPFELYAGETCKDTSSIIKRYHNTLEHLEWDMDTSKDTENIEHLQYPRLKKLRLCWRPQVVDKSFLLHYLKRIARQCQLKELLLRLNNTDQIAGILDAIYRYAQLECLKISIDGRWDPNGMEKFFDGLVISCPHLSCLELRNITAPSANTLNTLKRLEHLQRFACSIDGTDNLDDFWDALRTFSQLKHIRMYPIADCHRDRVKSLMGQRPDMKVIYSIHAPHF
ncbi:hypothetical protein O0I10_006325 [Lichtheimia ornata]|uniref:RNI-like protein n=1 Tax=Lichtheimia ornata TaxID=688661 RepID=A0AAD7XUZ6_9FUNG|nr:uncharacterized protein O0I10_006325 [Lichtheimia ornata]KAJ8658054.1 hypothetical protein O0I10_006325 [Lichtheimia ornata]